MGRLVFFIMVLVCLCPFGFANDNSSTLNLAFKGSFTGKITDALTGLSIAGASVYFTDVKSGTMSDAEGNFTINNIPEGKHLVEISHVGYSSIVEQVDISGIYRKDFTLSESIVENNMVVVTGVSSATQIKKLPFSVSSLKSQDLFQNTSSNIMDALTRIGGVSTLTTGPAISKPVIRGLSYNRVLTINDGVRQEGQQWGDEHGIEIDEASVNKIELFKGPASLIYGSDAMAGVVNIITNVPVAPNTVKASISSNYQSNNNLHSLNASIGMNRKGINWNLYSSNRAAEDYKNKYDGRVFNSKFNEQNLGGYFGYNGNWGYSHLIFSNFNLRSGLVEGERDAEGYFIKPVSGGLTERANAKDFNSTTPLIPYQRIRHFKIALDNSIKMGKNRLSFNVGIQRNQREEFGNVDDPAERALFFDLQTITYAAQFHFSEARGWKTSLGLNGMKQENTNKGLEQLIPNYDLFDYGMYVYSRKTINKITLSGGLRYDIRTIKVKDLLDGTSIKGPGFEKEFSNVSGSLGLTAQVSEKLNLKLNIARGFRAPGIPELASNGAHEGTTRYEYGDPNLKSETSLQLDGGASYATEHLSFGLSAFYNGFNNFIFYRKLQDEVGGDSIVVVDGEDLTAFKFDQRKAALAGLEVTLDIHPHPLDWLHILNSFSMVSGRFKEAIEGNKNIPFIPAPKLVTEFRGDFKKIKGPLNNLYVKFEVDNNFAQKNVFTTYNTETSTSGYTLLNAGIGADFTNKKDQTLFSLAFSAINLSDIAYQNHLSRLKYAAVNPATGRMGVFNMGRNFSIKLNVPLTVKLVK